MNTKFLREIEQIQKKFFQENIVSYHYVTLTLAANLVMFDLSKDDSFVTPQMREHIRTWNAGDKVIDENGLSIRYLVMEKDFLDAHNRFELLISDILSSLYNNFPKFLRRQKAKPDISYHDLENAVDLIDLKHTSIEKKILSVTKEKSTAAQIDFVLDLCGLSRVVQIPNRDSIPLLSILRNCLIHNNRVFSKIASELAKKTGCNHNFRPGENLMEYIGKETLNLKGVFHEVGNALVVSLMDNLLHIEKRHNALNEDLP